MASFKSVYNIIKHNIIATRNPNLGVANFFFSSPAEIVGKYAPALTKEAFFRSAITGRSFPTEISSLDKCGNMRWGTNLKNALLWTTLGIALCDKNLNSFLIDKDAFDHAFLWGQFEEAKSILDKVAEKYGQSLWEIKARIALDNEWHGVEAQKIRLKSVISELDKAPIPAYLLHSYSRLCESKVSIKAYISQIKREYKYHLENSIPESFAKYLRYKSCGYQFEQTQDMNFFDANTLAAFLFYDDTCPMIDRYLSLKDLMTSVFSSFDTAIKKDFLQAAVFLSARISDPFWDNLVQLKSKGFRHFYMDNIDQICDIFDEYTIGNYSSCITTVNQLIRKDIKYFPLIEVLIKSHMFSGGFIPAFPEKSPICRIAKKLWDLFTLNGDVLENHLEGMKCTLPHLDSAWAYQLTNIYKTHFSRMHSIEAPVLPNYYSAITTVNDISSIPLDALDEFLSSAPAVFQNSVATRFCECIRNGNSKSLELLDIENYRKQKYTAYLYLDESPEVALDVLRSMDTSTLPLAAALEIKEMLIKGEFECHHLQEALKLYIEGWFKNKNFTYSKLSDELFEAIKHSDPESCTVLSPVYCDIYLKNHWDGASGDDIVLSVSYDEFLCKLGITRPSEITKTLETDEWDEYYTYFLAEVCVPNVMDRSLAFDSYDDVLKERCFICSDLIYLDPKNVEKYEKEINSITGSMMTQRTKREVEKGKIYVDIDGVKTVLKKDLIDSYERYQDYQKHSMEDLVVRIIEALKISEKDGEPFILSYDNSAQLSELIKKARNVFVADNKYGLDGYLSVRIRHGTLESKLRSCFEKHKLITTKDLSGTYQDNNNWIKRRSVTQEDASKVLSLFASFSKEIDETISRIKKTMLQIKTEEKNENGLFDFSISDRDVSVIQDRLTDDTSFDSFLEIVIGYLMDLMDDNLNRIREAFTNEINGMFVSAIDTLQAKVIECSNTVEIAKLNDQLAAARTEISNELGRIGEWFRFNRPDDYPDYPLSIALSVSSDIINSFDSSFTLDAADVDESIKLRGTTLVGVVEILKILFDNIIKHGTDVEKKATVKAKRDKSTLVITVSNKVTKVNSVRIADISSRLHQWEKTDAISHEGGSGLLKIKKILSVDLNCENNVEIRLLDDFFSVVITANLEGKLI